MSRRAATPLLRSSSGVEILGQKNVGRWQWEEVGIGKVLYYIYIHIYIYVVKFLGI